MGDLRVDPQNMQLYKLLMPTGK